MYRNLSKKPKLLIVSDTAMNKDINGTNVFEPVARELENFHYMFSEITWIGYEKYRKNLRKIDKNIDVKFIILNNTSGTTVFHKIKSILMLVPYSFLIFKEIRKHDFVHTRAPSLPAFLAILYSIFDRKRGYWHKYAGSWVDENAPFFSRIQRALLKKARNTTVTINGKWLNQKDHILSFENPCLSEKELNLSKKFALQKRFNGDINFCFIGNLNENKGILKIIDAFHHINSERIGKVHIIGDGLEIEYYKDLAVNLPFVFHGYMLRTEINEILKDMHILLLPSLSEGFPKVVGESASYGVIPIVSSVSSLPQYICNEVNGFLLDEISSEGIQRAIIKIFNIEEKKLIEISQNALELSKKFTYEYYNARIENEILKKRENK